MSIDESVVQYFGHNPAEHFIRGKSVSFGCKWMISSSFGCYAIDVYFEKKKTSRNRTYQRYTPLGARIVTELLKNLPSKDESFFLPLLHHVSDDDLAEIE